MFSKTVKIKLPITFRHNVIPLILVGPDTAFMFTLSKTTKLDSSNLKEFADDNFSFDENDGKSSKRVENTVGKGVVAR